MTLDRTALWEGEEFVLGHVQHALRGPLRRERLDDVPATGSSRRVRRLEAQAVRRRDAERST